MRGAYPTDAAASQNASLEPVDMLMLARISACPARDARELQAAPDWRRQVTSLVARDALFRNAVWLASQGLRPSIAAAERGAVLDDRATIRLLAYATRMATRTTPFGAFASVGPVSFGPDELRIQRAHHRTARPNVDHGWLLRAVDLISDHAMAGGGDVIVIPATALHRDGPRLILLDERKIALRGDGSQYRSVSIAGTPAVLAAIELASGGIASSALAERLAERFCVDRDRARSLVTRLIEARFLHARPRPAPLDDSCERLTREAAHLPKLWPLIGIMGDITQARHSPLNLAVLDDAVERIRAIDSANVDDPVFYDLTHQRHAIPARVRDDVVRLADVLVRCGGREHLDAYRARFMERYESEDRLVPLLELVGPRGIGIPDGTEVERAESSPASRGRLAALIGAALAAGTRRIDISQSDWDLIRPPASAPLPTSLEVAFHVLAPTFEAVREGDYRMVSSPLTAAPCAGMTTARFAKYEGAAFVAALRAVFTGQAAPGTLTAEPLFIPEGARSGNVIAHPLIADTTIPINVHADGATLALEDLVVGIDGDRVALWSRSRRQRVEVVWPHAFNARLAPPLARFFALIARDGRRAPRPFDIGELALLPFIPRISLGRIVLRRATWTMPQAEIRARGLVELGAERGLPRFVQFGQHDNVLVVDTTTEAGAALLLDQSRARRPEELLQLSEAFVEDDDLWLRDATGSRYCSEYVASLRNTIPPPQSTRVPVFVDESARTRTPGSEWCYLKLYGNEREFRNEIAPHLLAFADTVAEQNLAEEWFFILYRDPDPHVRVRLRAAGDAHDLREHALSFAENLVRLKLVARYAFATYERELERYGGEAALTVCERLFHLDSVEALRTATSDFLSGRERLDAMLLPLCTLFDRLTVAEERSAWIEQRRPAAHVSSREETEAVRAAARFPAPPVAGDDHHAAARLLAALCASPSQHLSVLDSMLHMHLNRRGVPAEEEAQLRRLLWKTLFARTKKTSPCLT